MVLHHRSPLLRALLFISSPTPRLPRLLPIACEHARVGNNYTDYVRVYIG